MNKLFIVPILAITFLVGCALFEPVVIPSDREVSEVPGRPGYYIISGGHLQELYEQQAVLLEKLEACQVACKCR